MKMLIAFLLLGSGVAFAAHHPKQYVVGTVTAHHYTTATTTINCSGDQYRADCGSYDTDHDHALYDITLMDGSTHIIEHVLWTRDPLKHVYGGAPVRVHYRIQHRGGVDYVKILDTEGKEGTYSFAYHDGLNRKPHTEKAYGPAPVTR